jgi:23S rRNA pseudouridine1911/1915/1917 synthase
MPTSDHTLSLTHDAGSAVRLDKLLAEADPEHSRARFQSLIAGGHVTVDGRTILDASFRVKPGSQVTATVPPADDPDPLPEPMALDIEYEDASLIVINKPAGLVVHPGAGNATGTLVNALIAHCGDSLSGIGGVKRPGIVHRLDKDTSGLLVVAKNDKAHRALSSQFAAHGRDGRLTRSYLAIVWGAPWPRRGTIDTRLGRSQNNRLKMAVLKGEDAGRHAITHYETLEVYGAAEDGTRPLAALVRCELETGRTHQIRLHMAHIGHPLLGDSVYGSSHAASANRLDPTAREALDRLARQALHANVLGFDHPETEEKLVFEADMPADMQALADILKN